MSWFDKTHAKEKKKNSVVIMRSLMHRQNTIVVDFHFGLVYTIQIKLYLISTM